MGKLIMICLVVKRQEVQYSLVARCVRVPPGGRAISLSAMCQVTPILLLVLLIFVCLTTFLHQSRHLLIRKVRGSVLMGTEKLATG